MARRIIPSPDIKRLRIHSEFHAGTRKRREFAVSTDSKTVVEITVSGNREAEFRDLARKDGLRNRVRTSMDNGHRVLIVEDTRPTRLTTPLAVAHPPTARSEKLDRLSEQIDRRSARANARKTA